MELGGRCALLAPAQRTRPQPPGVGVVSEHLVGGGHLRILNAWSALRGRHLALPPTTWIDLFARQSRRPCGLQIHGAESIAW